MSVASSPQASATVWKAEDVGLSKGKVTRSLSMIFHSRFRVSKAVGLQGGAFVEEYATNARDTQKAAERPWQAAQDVQRGSGERIPDLLAAFEDLAGIRRCCAGDNFRNDVEERA
jgi:hypothetical protein